ncbi:MAG: carbohydrate ABC transporter permease [Dehalococcoidia bacterium]
MATDHTLGQRKIRLPEGILSILPALLVLIFMRFYPMLAAIYRSFTNWDGLYRSDWIGLTNYIQIFTNSPFWKLLRNSLVLLTTVPLQLMLGLFVAVLLYEEVRGWRLFRTIIYLPQIISAVTIGYLFRVAFSLDGPVNLVLRRVGLGAIASEWLGNTGTALGVLVFCLTWFSIGWQAIVILGGMAKISPEVFEAARMDGANYWQRTFHIVIPMLSRTIEYAVIMSMVWTLTSVFAFIFSITAGGPGYETSTLDYMIYRKFYMAGAPYGSASAYAVILLIIILVFTVIEMRVANRASQWE